MTSYFLQNVDIVTNDIFSLASFKINEIISWKHEVLFTCVKEKKKLISAHVRPQGLKKNPQECLKKCVYLMKRTLGTLAMEARRSNFKPTALSKELGKHASGRVWMEGGVYLGGDAIKVFPWKCLEPGTCMNHTGVPGSSTRTYWVLTLFWSDKPANSFSSE